MAVQLNTAGEISAIQIVEDNDYEIKSVDPDDDILKTYAESVSWKPVQTERSKEEYPLRMTVPEQPRNRNQRYIKCSITVYCYCSIVIKNV